MLETFKKLSEEKGLLKDLTGDKTTDVIILTTRILNDKELNETVISIGLNEAVNFITKDSKEGKIETSVKNLIKKYEKEI